MKVESQIDILSPENNYLDYQIHKIQRNITIFFRNVLFKSDARSDGEQNNFFILTWWDLLVFVMSKGKQLNFRFRQDKITL